MKETVPLTEQTRPRARDFGLHFGELTPGPLNAITDVAGVAVGHCSVQFGEGPLTPGRGPARTGVTAVVPHPGNTFLDKATAAVHVINGFGKAAGFIQVQECGGLETPILLTNTLSVGRVGDALVQYMLRDNPAIGVETGTVNPVVGECNDGWLNDIRGRHVTEEHVFAALEAARSGPVAEGAVGAGTGMMAFGWKGGIGTASRVVPGPDGSGRYVLGVLVLTNFGSARDLVVGGWPVGRFLPPPEEVARRLRDPAPQPAGPGDGSVVIVMATDAPLDSRQLGRVAARASVGLVRTGSRLAHGSGDYAIAFSTGRRIAHTLPSGVAAGAAASADLSSAFASPGNPPEAVPVRVLPDDGPVMAGLLRAAGEGTEEAVINSLFQARTVVGRDGHVGVALPVDEVVGLVERFRS